MTRPAPPARCCAAHGTGCEPTALCCLRCTEGTHPAHGDGTVCVHLPRQRVEAARFAAAAAAAPPVRDWWWW